MPSPKSKRENLLVNLACNVAIPTVILSYASGPKTLGPVGGLIVALLFPLGYGIYDYVQRRRANFISIVGFGSVLLTGGLGLMKVSGFWFAVKDAAVPALIGLGVMASLRSKTPIVREMFFNDLIVDVERIEAALDERGNRKGFGQLMVYTSLWLFGSFMLSSVLNFALATYLLKSPPGTEEFNAEIARMHVLSFPVIALPCVIVMMIAFWRLVAGLRGLTGLTTDQIFRADPAPAKPAEVEPGTPSPKAD